MANSNSRFMRKLMGIVPLFIAAPMLSLFVACGGYNSDPDRAGDCDQGCKVARQMERPATTATKGAVAAGKTIGSCNSDQGYS